MFEGFTRTDIDTGEARIHLRHGGKGPPLLLLHGNPMTHVSWHKMANELARDYHVVATDLRGYGDSSAPDPDPTCSNYSFRAMANDQVEVMRQLGYDRFYVAGHDRGARTTHRMALDHPEKVIKVAIIDILPTIHIWENTSRKWALGSWHWAMMPLDNGLPELMMAGVPPAVFIEKKISKPGVGLSIFDPEALAEYIRCFNPKTIKGSCADYRAAATVDVELDRIDREQGRKINCPVLLLWGAGSHTEGVYKDVIGVWRDYVSGEIVGEGLKSGHYVNEHRPAETLAWFQKFFVEG
jgi:haloacetate dehalogenase